MIFRNQKTLLPSVYLQFCVKVRQMVYRKSW